MMRIEIRECIKCGETKEIVQRHKHSSNICMDCQRIASREYQRQAAIKEGRRVGTTGRVPYPLEEGETTPGNKFKKMASKTFKLKTKEEWRELMRTRLNEVLNNDELLKWINSHDGEEVKDKKQSRIQTDYPNTKDMTWEDWEAGGWGQDIDS